MGKGRGGEGRVGGVCRLRWALLLIDFGRNSFTAPLLQYSICITLVLSWHSTSVMISLRRWIV